MRLGFFFFFTLLASAHCHFGGGRPHEHHGEHGAEQDHSSWRACTPDYKRFCAKIEVRPENYQAIYQCLLQNQEELTQDCATVVHVTQQRQGNPLPWWKCRSDLENFCGDVPQDDHTAVHDCMTEHAGELSEECKEVIRQHQQEANKPWWKCHADRLTYCGAVKVVDGDWNPLRECMVAHKEELNPECRELIVSTESEAPRRPWWKCRADRMKYCGAIQVENGDWSAVHACMVEHREELNPECRELIDAKEREKPVAEKQDVPDEVPSSSGFLLFSSCHVDRIKFCPDLLPPFRASTLFTSSCFIDHRDELSPDCRKMFDLFHTGTDYSPEVGQSPDDLYSSCHQDRVSLCPDIPPPYFPRKLFTSDCFLEKRLQLSERCRIMMDEYNRAEGAVQTQPLPPATQEGAVQQHPSEGSLLACHLDRVKFCPEVDPKDFLHSSCFFDNQDKIDKDCLAYAENRLAHEKGEQYPHAVVTLEALTVACQEGHDKYCPNVLLDLDFLSSKCFSDNKDQFSTICRFIAHSVNPEQVTADGNTPHDLGRECIEEWMSLCPAEWRESKGKPVIFFQTKCMETEAPRMSPMCLNLIKQMDPNIHTTEDACSSDISRFCSKESNKDKDALFQKSCFVSHINEISLPCRHDYLVWLHEHANNNYLDEAPQQDQNSHHGNHGHNEHDDHENGEHSEKHKHSVYMECSQDAQRFCGRVRSFKDKHFFNLQCIQQHKAHLSPQCAALMIHYEKRADYKDHFGQFFRELPVGAWILLGSAVIAAFIFTICFIKTVFCVEDGQMENMGLLFDMKGTKGSTDASIV